jgi:hypothetical protein
MVIPRNLISNFRFQIRPVTARDFPVTAVTGNPDPPRDFFFLSGTKILEWGEVIPGRPNDLWVFLCVRLSAFWFWRDTSGHATRTDRRWCFFFLGEKLFMADTIELFIILGRLQRWEVSPDKSRSRVKAFAYVVHSYIDWHDICPTVTVYTPLSKDDSPTLLPILFPLKVGIKKDAWKLAKKILWMFGKKLIIQKP